MRRGRRPRQTPAAAKAGQGTRDAVNSDDPAYFGGYLNQNFRAVSAALGLGRDEIVTIVRNGIQAALMTAEEEGRALAEVERVAAGMARSF